MVRLHYHCVLVPELGTCARQQLQAQLHQPRQREHRQERQRRGPEEGRLPERPHRAAVRDHLREQLRRRQGLPRRQVHHGHRNGDAPTEPRGACISTRLTRSASPSSTPSTCPTSTTCRLSSRAPSTAAESHRRSRWRSIWDVEFEPGQDVQTDSQWRDFARKSVLSFFHPVGTCAMLPQKDGGVVDSSLVVYGTENLRVVDASIIPVLLSGPHPDCHVRHRRACCEYHHSRCAVVMGFHV